MFFQMLNVVSQNIYFPKNLAKDSIALDNEMKKVAEFVLKNNKPDSTTSYYVSLLHAQILASEYEKATTSIDNYVDAYTINKLREGRVFLFRVYAKAKQLSQNKNIPFNKAFGKVFTQLYTDLAAVLKPEVTRSINEDIKVSESKNEILKLLKKYEEKDSISVNQAKSLCKIYGEYKIYNEAGKLANELLTREDKKFFEIEKDIVIPTIDGGEVTALVIRPKGVTKKLPAIFIYNIYAGSYDYEVAKRAAVNGYVGVAVNTRGKRLSKNEINPFEFDGKDAYHIIDWISKQKWCNGAVGMMGGSYLGFSQWSATKKMHPALKTIVPQVSVGIGIDYPMYNNIFMSYMLQWINYVDGNKFTDEASFADYEKWDTLFTNWYEKGYAFNKLDSLLDGKKNPIFQRWLSHPSYDSYWQNMVPYKDDFKNINIPVLTTTGYYDDDQPGALDYFKKHYQYNSNANHYLVIGPYSHGGGQHYPTKVINKYKIDPVALISIHELAYNWFDFIMKGKEKPALLKDKINYQVMGTNTWKHCASLEKMNTNKLQFYLTDITNGDAYKMTQKKPQIKGHISYEIDLSERDKNDKQWSLYDDIVSSKIHSQNALSFVSETFDKDVIINGSFSGELTVVTNKKDVDVFINLYEIRPDGSYFYLSNYAGRASYAKNNEKRELLQPFKAYTFSIKRSYMTSKKISKGSKLLVLMGVNKSKDWEINYGTGKPVSEETIEDAGEPLLVQFKNSSYISIGYDIYIKK